MATLLGTLFNFRSSRFFLPDQFWMMSKQNLPTAETQLVS